MCVENGAGWRLRPENGTGWSMRAENGAGWCMNKITDSCKQSQNRRKSVDHDRMCEVTKPCIYHVKMPRAPSSGFPSSTLFIVIKKPISPVLWSTLLCVKNKSLLVWVKNESLRVRVMNQSLCVCVNHESRCGERLSFTTHFTSTLQPCNAVICISCHINWNNEYQDKQVPQPKWGIRRVKNEKDCGMW